MLVFAASDKGGTGRSVTSANLAYQRALAGDHVAYVDFDFGSPTAAAVFDVPAAMRGIEDRGLHSYLEGEVAEPARIDVWRQTEHQLLRTRIPAHAAVASTVDIVRFESGSKLAGFANAVLRSVTERDEQGWIDELAPAREEDPVGHLAMRHAHPRWIAQAFADALNDYADAVEGGTDPTTALIAAFTDVQPLADETDALMSELSDACGIEVE